MMQAWAPVGMHKYHSFMEYVQLYPEYDFIFLGDNGQGDAMCADRVIEKAGESPVTKGSFSNNGTVSFFQTELSPAWRCRTPHAHVLSSQDV